MLCTLVIIVLAAIVVFQNRAALWGDFQELKRIWGRKPPTA